MDADEPAASRFGPENVETTSEAAVFVRQPRSQDEETLTNLLHLSIRKILIMCEIYTILEKPAGEQE